MVVLLLLAVATAMLLAALMYLLDDKEDMLHCTAAMSTEEAVLVVLPLQGPAMPMLLEALAQ